MKLFNFFKSLFKISNTKNSLQEDSSLESFLFSTLGYHTDKIELYKQAFTHPSKSKQQNYERLEFLGDAILGAVVSDYLYNYFKNVPEGKLSVYRSQIVNRKTLNRLALQIGLGKHIYASPNAQKGNSVLGNCLEAFVGAVYIDKGFHVSKKFIEKYIIGQISIDELPENVISFKSKLIELVVKHKKEFKFELINEGGLDHQKEYTIGFYLNDDLVEKATGSSKKKAEEKVSKASLASEKLKKVLS
jgi:ribonuclease-3